jgi:XTP/dITP diphosphohydrolase
MTSSPDQLTPNALQELSAVVARLRDPETGCPWDLEQTHTSLVPYVLEEAHEVADAIRHGDDAHLEEELGDLLLQVVLHAQIASEQGRFTLEQVARGITEKLIRRHPHVFAEDAPTQLNRGRGGDASAVRASWEAIKAEERGGREPEPGQLSASPLSDQLARKVRGQPALAGAMTISRKAAAAGFEWDDLAGVWAKVHEELDELKEALQQADAPALSSADRSSAEPSPADRSHADRSHAEAELGDLLFTLVNVARWCGLDPEAGLAGTNRRFLQRFARVEAALGGELQGRSLAELETLWRQAKAEIRVALGNPRA